MIYVHLLLFIIGTILGSIYCYICNRRCNNESIVSRPQCDNCNHKLAWYELIPVISYIIQGGKCRKCRIKLSKEYLFSELFTGLLFVSSFVLFGFSYKTIILLIILSLLVIIYITDFKYMIILDECLLIALIGIIITYFIHFDYLYVIQSLLRGLIIFGLFLCIKIVGDKVFKQESLGWGDIKLSFIAGLLLGVKLGLVYLFLGAVLALPYAVKVKLSKKNIHVPFGPFLISSLCIIYILYDEISFILNILLGV